MQATMVSKETDNTGDSKQALVPCGFGCQQEENNMLDNDVENRTIRIQYLKIFLCFRRCIQLLHLTN